MTRGWTFVDAPRGWYFAASSRELRPGARVALSVAGVDVVLTRSASGAPQATGAASRSVRVVERYGAVLVFPATGDAPPAPEFSGAPRLATRVGRSTTLACHWAGVVANAFDLQHLGVVHRRSLEGPPRVEQAGADRFRLEYVSRVTGRTVADRAMHRLSGGSIRAAIECWSGTTIVVTSEIGQWRAWLMLCIVPSGDSVAATPIVGVPATRAAVAIQSRVATWLYSAFLERDVALLDRMRFRPAPILPEDATLVRCLDYLSSLESLWRCSVECRQ